ncbi:hypothetical protein BSZ35_09285 [Salinibacter sp. 10B]|uniref:GLUG motif-containing protein n=1 Tax=Salinibacter sp. 10B TaxID=1923971 RepID=UPI000CF54E0D|nr:GLUG motif-containing protein [Salinibacter sp. 10B]PQJ34764.1 hypothetical protein BSZ35_09285 [Salinibacter sp. 10B]
MSFLSVSSSRRSCSRPLAILLLLGPLLLTGCDGIGTSEAPDREAPDQNDGGGQAPALSIGRTAYDYGFVHVDTPQRRTVALINNGSPPPDSANRTGALEGDVALAGTDTERFTIESGDGSFTLAPGDTLDVLVSFDPEKDRVTSRAQLEITHNDTDRKTPLPVPLQGDGVVFEGGSGSANAPYQIARPDQLQVINNGLRTEDFVMVGDVDASVTRNWNEGDGFIPIGERTDGERFTGTFDGAGHVVSDLWIRRSDTNGIGLFAALGNTSLHDVTLRGVEISGGSQTGALVGQNAGGTIEFVSVTGTVNGNVGVGGVAGLNFDNGTLRSVQSRASVQGEALVGGLAGRNHESSIRNATTEGAVEGKGPAGEVGGLVGRNVQGEIRRSSAQGDVSSNGSRGQVGGLVGRNVGGTIADASYAAGTVQALASAGGLVGANFAGGTLRTSTASGNVISTDRAGGLVGRNAVTGRLQTSSATASVDADRNAGGLVGLNRAQVHGCWARGPVQGKTNVGGLAGANLGVIEASYAHSSVAGDTRVGGLVGRGNGGTLQQAYAAGSVSGSTDVGGLVGRQAGSTVSSSYWDTNTTNQSRPVGTQEETSVEATGLSTGQMTGAAAAEHMPGLDFTEMWMPIDGAYPALRWEE